MTTSVKSLQKGFTIIEVVLVLAISALLLLIAFLGQGATTKQARFRDSVEDFKAQMESVRDSVNNTVIEEAEGCVGDPASSADCIKFGQVVTLVNNSDNFTVQTILADGPAATSVDETVRVSDPELLLPDDPSSINRNFRWGTTPIQTGAGLPRIAFVRHAATGKLETHIISDGASLTSQATYSNPFERYVLQLRSPECYAAQIVFNDTPNSIDVRMDQGDVC